MCGEFSAKFASVTARAPHLDDPEVIESAPGTAPVAKANPDVDVYAFPHNETSTGVMLPVAAAGRPPTALVLVDATSGAGGLRVDPAEFDVYYFAPQKCFAGDAGIWLALCSPAAIERIERIAASGRWVPPSLDLGIALEQSRLDQTYNTPALATLFLLADQVEWMLANGGLEWAAGRCDESAETIYSWADAGIAHDSVRHRSRRCAAASPRRSTSTPTVDAAALAKVLRANGILDVEPYRKLGRNQLRVGLFPAIEPADVAVLTRAIDYIVERLGPVDGVDGSVDAGRRRATLARDAPLYRDRARRARRGGEARLPDLHPRRAGAARSRDAARCASTRRTTRPSPRGSPRPTTPRSTSRSRSRSTPSRRCCASRAARSRAAPKAGRASAGRR